MFGPPGATERSRDWFWLEALLLVTVLVAGAVLRYWLSTVEPFDASEVAFLEDATDPERAMRVPFIMMNGVSLFLLYVVVRRGAGVGAAFAALLALQSSLAFQLEAARVRPWGPVCLVALFALAYFRLTRPPKRLPPKLELALGAAALLFFLAELRLVLTLPERLRETRQTKAADVVLLSRELASCGHPTELPLARLGTCPISWPRTRSLDQQEALWEHQRRLGGHARAIDDPRDLPADASATAVALLDSRGAGFILVDEGPLARTARRVLLDDATLAHVR